MKKNKEKITNVESWFQMLPNHVFVNFTFLFHKSVFNEQYADVETIEEMSESK